MNCFSNRKDCVISQMSDGWDLKLKRLFHVIAVMGLACMLNVGCNNTPGRVRPPSIGASEAGEAAVAEFDQDSDGKLSAFELKQAPGIRLDTLDGDADGFLSSDEISKRITQWQGSGVGQLSHNLMVKLDGKPLVGAEVTLEPYAFLGSNVLVAIGMTERDGVVVPAIEKSARAAPNVPVMQYGFYRIRISKKLDGKEQIPKRYNVESELGCEVAPNQRGSAKAINISS